jgi:hypothetical protein
MESERVSWRVGLLYLAFALVVMTAVGLVLDAAAPGLSAGWRFLIVIGGGSAAARLLFFAIARR